MNQERKTKIDNFKKNAINRFFTPGAILIFKRRPTHGMQDGIHFESILPRNKILTTIPRNHDGSIRHITKGIVKYLKKVKSRRRSYRQFQWLRRKKYITKINCKYKKLSEPLSQYYTITAIKCKYDSLMVILDRPQKIKTYNIEQYVVPVLYNEKVVYIRLSSRKNPRKFWKKIEAARQGIQTR